MSLHKSIILALPSDITTPTEIQSQVVPEFLSRKDMLALANTGSGKTLAYTLPILHHLMTPKGNERAVIHQGSPKALILVPTRELAFQVTDVINEMATKLNIATICLCGGTNKQEQQQALAHNPEIIIATTGRLLDLEKDGSLTLTDVNYLVLDEADRLLDMGFWSDVERIAALTSKTRQTALFSATFSDKLQQQATTLLSNPIQVSAHQENSVNQDITETLYLVNKGSKPNALIALINKHQWQRVLVFIGAKENADKLTKKLVKAGILANALHGNKSQTERAQTLASFKSGKTKVLIATDVLARGIDIESLPVVINFDLPLHSETYVHRVGRTARAGIKGEAFSLVCHGEMSAFKAILQLTQRQLDLQNLEGFPVTDKPASGESTRAPRDKKANRRTQNKKSVKQFKKKPR
jgi:superfamily II DNA/RNA helicase